MKGMSCGAAARGMRRGAGIWEEIGQLAPTGLRPLSRDYARLLSDSESKSGAEAPHSKIEAVTSRVPADRYGVRGPDTVPRLREREARLAPPSAAALRVAIAGLRRSRGDFILTPSSLPSPPDIPHLVSPTRVKPARSIARWTSGACMNVRQTRPLRRFSAITSMMP